MSKDINFKQITKSGKSIATFAKRYATFTFFIGILCVYAFLVFRISVLSKTEPTDEQITEQSSTTKRLKIDEDSITKIQQLQDQNVGVQSEFQKARDNPFN